MKYIVIYILMSVSIALLFAVGWVDTAGFPIGELAGQWAWLANTSVLFAVCIFFVLIVWYRDHVVTMSFYRCIIWALILLGGMEATLCGLDNFLGSS